MTIFDKFLINNRTKSYDDCLVEALADFDFNLHWAMCHNEVNRILGRGGSEEIRYVPVEKWDCVSYLSAANEWLKRGGKPKEDLNVKDTITWETMKPKTHYLRDFINSESQRAHYRNVFGVWPSSREMRAVLNRAEGI